MYLTERHHIKGCVPVSFLEIVSPGNHSYDMGALRALFWVFGWLQGQCLLVCRTAFESVYVQLRDPFHTTFTL